MNYGKILKTAYNITINQPYLWFCGLFLSGGFNANFFYFLNLSRGWRDRGSLTVLWLLHLAPARIIFGGIASLLLVSVLVVISNWAKVIFILRSSDLLGLHRIRKYENPMPFSKTILTESPEFLLPVVSMSLFTMVGMMVITAILGGAPQWLFNSHGLVWGLAGVLFLALTFFFSCLNIFGTFFIIFYRCRFTQGLNLAFDLLRARLRPILVMALILTAIYGVCFFAAALVWVLLLPPAGILMLWLWMAVVNTFFNLSLLLLFAQLVQPPRDPDFKAVIPGVPSQLPSTQMMDKTPNPL